MNAPRASGDRLFTFEIGGAVYALPISGVLEVAEVSALACIPTLPSAIGGVMNNHGEALPVISSAALLDLDPEALPPPQHVLAISDRSADTARLGLGVDRVLGLVDAHGAIARGRHPVAEQRPIEGRVAHVIDPRRLVERAREVIEASLHGAGNRA